MSDFRILVTDDDEDDYALILQAFLELELKHRVENIKDGNQLLAYLAQAADSGDKLPDLVLLDVNMPMMNGIQVLEQLRENHLYMHIPVIMYSTSASAGEKSRCMELGASAFVTKGDNYGRVLSFAQNIDDFLKRLSMPSGSDIIDNRGVAGY